MYLRRNCRVLILCHPYQEELSSALRSVRNAEGERDCAREEADRQLDACALLEMELQKLEGELAAKVRCDRSLDSGDACALLQIWLRNLEEELAVKMPHDCYVDSHDDHARHQMQLQTLQEELNNFGGFAEARWRSSEDVDRAALNFLRLKIVMRDEGLSQ